jgi:exodeoxyribonuclease V beta subunit
MEFSFPVGTRGARTRLVTPKRLVEVFRQHSRLPGTYLERLSKLGFTPLEGYLRGFIDLVFEYEGRYFVVDYKSNHLGSDAACYEPALLDEVMMHHHYHLQYHIYLLALHRYLESRLTGYDYDRHVGGALYLFVRGMSRDGAVGNGVFFCRPSRDSIVALSKLFEARSESSPEASP